MTFEILFFLAVLVIGTLGALSWWRIAAKAAPYDDEIARKRRRKSRGELPTVIKGFGQSGSDREN